MYNGRGLEAWLRYQTRTDNLCKHCERLRDNTEYDGPRSNHEYRPWIDQEKDNTLCARVMGARVTKGRILDRVVPLGIAGARNDVLEQLTKIMKQIEGKTPEEMQASWKEKVVLHVMALE